MLPGGWPGVFPTSRESGEAGVCELFKEENSARTAKYQLEWYGENGWPCGKGNYGLFNFANQEFNGEWVYTGKVPGLWSGQQGDLGIAGTPPRQRTLVTSLLITWHSAEGRSTVSAPYGVELLNIILSESRTLLLGDDRATLHAVSASRALDAVRPAHPVMLITVLAPG